MEKSNCTFHIVENIKNYKCFFHKIHLTVDVLLPYFPLSTLCMESYNPFILHIVKHKLFYFRFCGKFRPFFPQCGKFKLYFPHCWKYHKVLPTFWKLSGFLPHYHLNFFTVTIHIVNFLEHFFHMSSIEPTDLWALPWPGKFLPHTCAHAISHLSFIWLRFG